MKVEAGTRRPERGVDLKRHVVGRPLASDEMDETLLRKLIALPIFASDPLSSVAYATEAALVVLLGVSATAGGLVLPVSIAIAALLGIVVLSYRQTVRAYESSGGAYLVSKENLGTLPSLVAGAALLTDYVLTVAVSVAAGVFAITSAAPALSGAKVELCVAFIALLTFANLRGVKEAGILFALPTYAFVAVMYVTIGTGIVRCAAGSCPQAVAPHPLPTGLGTVGLLVLLKAFASGSAALTGVEAISNGVSAFRRPQARNAARTLTAMGLIAISLFLGVSWLAVHMHAKPSSTVSVLSQIARAAFPAGSAGSIVYYLVQALTFAILVLAANTSYQGFPRLAALLARDRFFPRQFVNLGDRLVYSNGIVVLAAAAAGLIVVFGANVDSLIHLYVIGVFTAFTLSQAGMVRYWRRVQGDRWRSSAFMNGLGATATALVLVVVIWTKFAEGAWAVTIAVPLLVLSFYGIRRHYRKIARRLRAGTAAVASAPPVANTVLVTVRELDDATQEALWLAKRISGRGFRALHVEGSAPLGRDPRGRWWEASGGARPIELLDNCDGDAALEVVWGLPRGESQFVTVVVPEQFERPSLLAAVRRPEFRLKLRLLNEPSVVTAVVPSVGTLEAPLERAVCRILVSGAHAGTLRAVRYAQSLGLDDTRAVFFAADEADAERLRRNWARLGSDVRLEVDRAPFRDIGDPLRRHVRELTADPGTLAVVVLPELVVHGPARLLHNQRALYVKRMLLFEPRVVLASVPYRLD